MTDLHHSLALLQGSTPLAPLHDLDVEPGEQQRALLARILTHILGGQSPTLAPGAAGTGKTTMIRLLLRLLLAAGLRVVVATPTHKARTRVEETLGDLGVEVVTHHSLWCGGAVEEIEEGEEYADDLHLSPAETPRDHPYDVVVVDEASMLTASDLDNLTECLREDCVIVGTGDHHQLPPVGGPAGFDWRGADDYGLTKVYRQEGGSPVLDAATAIREQGVPFTFSKVANFGAGDRILKAAGVPVRWTDPNEVGYQLALAIKEHGGGLSSAVAVCGTHQSRVLVTDATRFHLGLPRRREGPAIGERVIARASGGGLTNSTQGTVMAVSAQDFGGRFGSGWIVHLDTEHGQRRVVGVLEQSWLQTDRTKHRGLVPYSIRQMIQTYSEEDVAENEAEIAMQMLSRTRAYLAKRPGTNSVPEWLTARWRGELCALLGAWGPWLQAHLAALDSAYAITCHASQGSQWQEVFVVADCVDFVGRSHEDSQQIDPTQVYRWSYTAITRAVERAVVVKKSRGHWDEPAPLTDVEIGTASRDWQAKRSNRR